MNDTLKRILVLPGIILLFAVLSYGFVPQVFSGKVLNQSDTSSWKGMTHEISEHNAAHPDDKTLWTNSMFGGMPTVSMYDDFSGDITKPLYGLLMSGKRPANWLFVSLLGAFLLMAAFGLQTVLCVAGAIAVTFCSYNMQIIQVGHNTKMQAIAFMPWVLAGIVFTYRSALKAPGTGIFSDKCVPLKEWLPKTALGAVLFAVALSMQIKANHPQITYYLAIVIFLYAAAVFISLCASRDGRKGIGRFFAASALLLVIGGTGIATNLNKLIPTYEYAKHTMRGGSELSGREGRSDGLDIEYATAWSYGIEETPNLMIPNFNGGASSGELGRDSETYELLRRAGQQNLNKVMKALPLYWGPQPFTAGPMYMGAITVFLFILGLCLCRGKEKWWLLAATVIAVFLAWGNHFMWFTELWFDYAPMYNKFRTVSMALVVLQITLPLLGFIALDKIFREEYPKKTIMTAGWTAYGIAAGFCLLFIIFPGLAGSFVSGRDAGLGDLLTEALAADRRHLLVADALRSFFLISAAWALIMWACMAKDAAAGRKRTTAAAVVICLAVCFDMWSAGKRYLDGDDFISARDFSGQFAERPVDKIIHSDPDPHYRVLDISVNTFNDAFQSYQHKCIGGYSPAKLQRYQDIIDRYLTQEIGAAVKTVNGAQTVSEVQEKLPFMPVVSMLNGKYVIIGGEYQPVVNRYAFGNAWFADDFVYAESPDMEINLIGTVDLRNTAVIGPDFHDASAAVVSGADGTENDFIELVSYAPNELKYRYSVSSPRAVVFSEVYYPDGWKAWTTENGTERRDIDIFRADWLLRAAVLPAGEGDLTMRFEPESYRTGERLSLAGSITLLLLLLLSLGAVIILPRR